VFAAFEKTPLEDVRAVILGQDPYANARQACGLAFAVPAGEDPPLSLRRIINKVEDDLGCTVSPLATLETWARNGVLLLNTALTVEAGNPNSHRAIWRPFTCAVLQTLADQPRQMVFLLWGGNAKRMRRFIDNGQHIICESGHPAARLASSDRSSFASSHPFRETSDLVNWKLG
jgi:uracil-DNA glycosylase